MSITPDLAYYAVVALSTAASAYGSLRARIKALEKGQATLTSSVQALHEKIDTLRPGPSNLRITDPSLR